MCHVAGPQEILLSPCTSSLSYWLLPLFWYLFWIWYRFLLSRYRSLCLYFEPRVEHSGTSSGEVVLLMLSWMVSVELDYTGRIRSCLQWLIMSGWAINKSRYICWEVDDGDIFIQWSEQQFPNFTWPFTSAEYFSPSGMLSWSTFTVNEASQLFWNPRALGIYGLYSFISQAVWIAPYTRKLHTVQYWHGEWANIY